MSEPPNEKRRAYRVTPETSDHIRASAVLSDGVEAAAELINAATGGVAVRFPHLRRGDLEPGQAIHFCFRSERLLRPLVLAGQVVQVRRGRDTPLEAGIAFIDWARAARDMEPIFRRLFNERRCFRVPPSTEDVERFAIVLRSGRGARSVRTWLRDISASGIGLWVQTRRVHIPGPDDAATRLQLVFGGKEPPAVVGDALELKLDMPGQRAPFVLPVRLRHIAAWPGAPQARLGLEFPAERDMPRDAHAAIIQYVGDRQRQLRLIEKEAREQIAEEARPMEATGAALERGTK